MIPLHLSPLSLRSFCAWDHGILSSPSPLPLFLYQSTTVDISLSTLYAVSPFSPLLPQPGMKGMDIFNREYSSGGFFLERQIFLRPLILSENNGHPLFHFKIMMLMMNILPLTFKKKRFIEDFCPDQRGLYQKIVWLSKKNFETPYFLSKMLRSLNNSLILISSYILAAD